MSPSSQRVWIEIITALSAYTDISVALFTEGVDWNSCLCVMYSRSVTVALFTEGVDWNRIIGRWDAKKTRRPLHRGCGLKLKKDIRKLALKSVALFTEGVDWNAFFCNKTNQINVALFTEGVDWNTVPLHYNFYGKVALFTEGVDWNF